MLTRQQLIQDLAKTHSHFITVEDHAILGGAGSAVNELMAANAIVLPVLNIGIHDKFVDHGSQNEIYAMLGLDSAGIERSIRAFVLKSD